MARHSIGDELLGQLGTLARVRAGAGVPRATSPWLCTRHQYPAQGLTY